MSRLIVMLFFFVFLTNCASLNSVSLTPIPANRKNVVTAEARRTIFFMFNFDNDFVDEVTEDLNRQCPNGKITGLLTKDQTIMYFGVFVWQKRITVSGYCVPITQASLQNNRSIAYIKTFGHS